MRHSWDPSMDGYLKCGNCSLEVKAYRVKRGGLPPCNPLTKEGYVEDMGDIVTCPSCGKEVPNSIVCIYCAHQLHPLNWERS